LQRLEILEKRVKYLEGIVERIGAAFGGGGGARPPGVGAVADDSDLDGQHGDVRVKYGLKVKYWKEQPDPFVGKKWSQCSPEYLDASAKYLDACAFMAQKEGGEDNEKKARYKALDASRARGWAARIRGGWVAPPEPESSFASDGGGGFGDAGGFGDGAPLPVDPMAGDAFDFGANVDDSELPL
jgi:hypothetical protein